MQEITSADASKSASRMRRSSNIFLLGLSGSGKSSTGKALARELGLGFIDTDEIVEQRSGKSISEIFAEGGEKTFRQLEEESLSALEGIRNHVISLGGGAVMSDSNWQKVQNLGTTVWLDVPTQRVARNLLAEGKLETRPLLKDSGDDLASVQKTVESIGQERLQRYQEAAFIVYSDHNDINNLCMRIKDQLNRAKKQRH